MTRLRHENPPHREPDPGAVITVPDSPRPFKPTREMQRNAEQIYRERENRKRREAERKRWENVAPLEIARIVNALISALESAPIPGPTETMKEFRARSNAWWNSKKRLDALRRGRGEA